MRVCLKTFALQGHEELALLGCQVARKNHIERYDEVATLPLFLVQREALAFETAPTARLHASLYLDAHTARERLHLGISTQYGSSKRNGDIDIQVVALAYEIGVRCYAEGDV